MTFNRLVDAAMDGRNPRTAGRALATGEVSRRAAWAFFGACAFGFVGTTVLFYRGVGGWFGYGNPWPAVWAGPVLAFICLYSYSKRFTWASHFWLGAALMLGPVAGWAASAPPAGPVVAAAPVVLGLGVLLWVAGFDMVYACQDVEVDRREGLHSLPARMGVANALWVSRLCHSLAVTFFLVLAWVVPFGRAYLAGVAGAAAILSVEHVLVVRGRPGLAFSLNLVVGPLLAGVAIGELLWREG